MSIQNITMNKVSRFKKELQSDFLNEKKAKLSVITFSFSLRVTKRVTVIEGAGFKLGIKHDRTRQEG